MNNFYDRNDPEIITEQEMIDRYGTNKAIPELHIVSTEEAKRIVEAELKLLTK